MLGVRPEDPEAGGSRPDFHTHSQKPLGPAWPVAVYADPLKDLWPCALMEGA